MQVPHVTRTDYQLIDISEDGFVRLKHNVINLVVFIVHSILDLFHYTQVSLLTENGNTKDDLRLPTDENLLSQVSARIYVVQLN